MVSKSLQFKPGDLVWYFRRVSVSYGGKIPAVFVKALGNTRAELEFNDPRTGLLRIGVAQLDNLEPRVKSKGGA